MNENEKLTEVNEITQLLIRLRPARSEIDSRVVFFDAGFNACQSQSQSSRQRLKIAPLIAAGLLAAIVTAPASYRWGQNAAFQTAQRNARVAVIDQAVEAAPVKRLPEEMTPEEMTPNEQPMRVDTPGEIRKPTAGDKFEWFARWIDPWSGLVESAGLPGKTETTLTAFHGSLASRQDADRNWIDFPLATQLATYRGPRGATYDNPSESASPLAVGDLTQLVRSLESSR